MSCPSGCGSAASLVIEPLRKRGLVDLLNTMKPVAEDFPGIDDPVPTHHSE
jgi:antitoxin VapB